MFNSHIIFEFRGPMGVPVQIDRTFFMLFVMLVIIGGGTDIIWALSFFAMLAVSIFLHELGHAWGNLVQGVPVRRIVMHGGGGFCESRRSPSRREEEFTVAMGPIVNLALWAVSGLILKYALPHNAYAISTYLSIFSYLNLMLAIFNLIPVQPLDGGKLFQLGLLRFVSTSSATRIAGAVGLVLAVLWIPTAVWFFITYGWILFFFPSIALHYQMFKLKRA